MSQYPYPGPPYSPPYAGPGMWTNAPPNAGRSAAIWQLVLGALIFVAGTCVMTLVWAFPDELFAEAVRQQGGNLPSMSGFSPGQVFRLYCTISSAVALFTGALLLVLAFFVGRGGKGSTIISLILNGLVSLFLLASFISALVQLPANPLQAALPTLIYLGMLILSGITITKLFVAFKSPGTAQAQAMQQAHYWMMQQQQAGGGYAQQGYGYGQHNPLPPPPPPDQNPGGPPNSGHT